MEVPEKLTTEFSLIEKRPDGSELHDGGRKEIADKINEIIDYLKTKESEL